MANIRSKDGRPRKSRRKRLPVASTGAPPEFDPSEGDWERIEAAYQFFNQPDRQAISEIVDAYLDWEGFERAAPYLDDALAWLEKARKAAKSFQECLYSGGDAVFYAQRYVARNVNHHLFEPDGPMDWSDLISFMTYFRSALARAEKEIPNEARVGFAEGEAWEQMVRKLSDYCDSRGYPTGASKGKNKSANQQTSPFVALIREIQQCFPEDCRRHGQSDDALAQGITEARRKRREAKSAEEQI